MNYQNLKQRQQQQAWKAYLRMDPMNCIIDPAGTSGGLYLGNIDAAQNVTMLRKHNIGAVLTVAARTGLSYDHGLIPHHEIILADDIESYNLSKHFPKMLDFIDQHIQSTNVLVHCFAGVSRSATTVIAYLIKTRQWNLEKALSHCRSKRIVTNPNQGFMQQLMTFEKKHIEQLNPTTSSINVQPLSSFITPQTRIKTSNYDYNRPINYQNSNALNILTENQNLITLPKRQMEKQKINPLQLSTISKDPVKSIESFYEYLPASKQIDSQQIKQNLFRHKDTDYHLNRTTASVGKSDFSRTFTEQFREGKVRFRDLNNSSISNQNDPVYSTLKYQRNASASTNPKHKQFDEEQYTSHSKQISNYNNSLRNSYYQTPSFDPSTKYVQSSKKSYAFPESTYSSSYGSGYKMPVSYNPAYYPIKRPTFSDKPRF